MRRACFCWPRRAQRRCLEAARFVWGVGRFAPPPPPACGPAKGDAPSPTPSPRPNPPPLLLHELARFPIIPLFKKAPSVATRAVLDGSSAAVPAASNANCKMVRQAMAATAGTAASPGRTRARAARPRAAPWKGACANQNGVRRGLSRLEASTAGAPAKETRVPAPARPRAAHAQGGVRGVGLAIAGRGAGRAPGRRVLENAGGRRGGQPFFSRPLAHFQLPRRPRTGPPTPPP